MSSSLQVCLAVLLLHAAAAQAQCGTVRDPSPWGVATSKPASLDIQRWLGALTGRGVHGLRAEAMLMVHKQQYPVFTATDRLAILHAPLNGAFPDTLTWSAYVSDMVQRAAVKGKVFDWEVWNEPPNYSSDKRPASYAALVRSTATVAKAVDPRNRVGLAAASANLGWLHQTIQAGAGGSFDFVTLHPYELATKLDQGFEALFMSLKPNVDRVLAAHGLSSVPIRLTEVGGGTAATLEPQQRINRLVKTHVLSLAQGLERVYWFEGSDQPPTAAGERLTSGAGLQHRTLVPGTTWTSGFNPDPSLTWLGWLTEYLGDKPSFRGWVKLDGEHLGYVFMGAPERHGGQVVVVAWSGPDGSDIDQALLGPVQQLDGSTGALSWVDSVRLSPAPTLLVADLAADGQGAAWLASAEAQCGQPFPWGGDYSNKQAVTMRPTTARRSLNEKGLHPLTPAYRVNDQGLWVMDVASTGLSVQKFAVDPNFLPWSPTSPPLLVTAQIRRSPGATLPVKLHLEFESRRGVNALPSGGGSVSLKDSSWHTVQWTLPDPQFAGTWGYHFALVHDVVAGQTAPTPEYQLRQLSVRKASTSP